MLSKVGGFLAGSGLGSVFVCNMDDVIYGQLRRNVILPFRQALFGAPGKQASLDDLFELSSGTANFVSQFKPLSVGPHNARALIIDEQEYSTPSDHYFGYINRRQGQTQTVAKEEELKVMKSLGLEVLLPPTFNLATGKFDEPALLDESGQVLDEHEMDVFELARLRGSSVNKLRVMNETAEEAAAKRGQRHSKKDYEKLKQLSMADIVAMAKEEKTYKPYQDDQLDGIVKVEKKKSFKRKTREERKAREEEMKRLLDSPQDINYERAMKLYEEQPLEAKEITAREKKKLRRLKRKASAQEEAAASIKIDVPVVDSDNVDSLLK